MQPSTFFMTTDGQENHTLRVVHFGARPATTGVEPPPEVPGRWSPNAGIRIVDSCVDSPLLRLRFASIGTLPGLRQKSSVPTRCAPATHARAHCMSYASREESIDRTRIARDVGQTWSSACGIAPDAVIVVSTASSGSRSREELDREKAGVRSRASSSLQTTETRSISAKGSHTILRRFLMHSWGSNVPFKTFNMDRGISIQVSSLLARCARQRAGAGPGSRLWEAGIPQAIIVAVCKESISSLLSASPAGRQRYYADRNRQGDRDDDVGMASGGGVHEVLRESGAGSVAKGQVATAIPARRVYE